MPQTKKQWETEWSVMNEAYAQALKVALTPERLDFLRYSARVYGWTGDYTEIHAFLKWCYAIAELPCPEGPDLEPIMNIWEAEHPRPGWECGR